MHLCLFVGCLFVCLFTASKFASDAMLAPNFVMLESFPVCGVTMDEEAAAVEVLLTTAPEEGALGAALAGTTAPSPIGLGL